MERIQPAILTNMCVIYDGTRVLVQDRVKKDWAGITFPGGHVEPNESFVDAVIREVEEETGLLIKNPKLFGIQSWADFDGARYIALLYKTNQFSGTLKGAPTKIDEHAALESAGAQVSPLMSAGAQVSPLMSEGAARSSDEPVAFDGNSSEPETVDGNTSELGKILLDQREPEGVARNSSELGAVDRNTSELGKILLDQREPEGVARSSSELGTVDGRAVKSEAAPEGALYWVEASEIPFMKLAPYTEDVLKLFLNPELSEAFYYSEDGKDKSKIL